MPNFTKTEAPPRDMEDIARETGGWHETRKEATSELSKKRLEFFEAATKLLAKEARAKTTYHIGDKGMNLVDAEARVTKYMPGWKISSSRGDKGTGWKFQLVEDPDYISFQIITKPTDDDPGYVVTRTIRSGSTMIDLDRMAIEQPALYESVTTLPDWAYTALHYMSDTEDWEAWVRDIGVERQPKNPDDLSPAEVEAIKPYVYEGPKTAALNVRLAKPEDYDEPAS